MQGDTQFTQDDGCDERVEDIAAVDFGNQTMQETEEVFRVKNKLDSISYINSLCFLEDEEAALRIPLCRMRAMPLVRPVLRTDILRLQAEFSFGYRSGDRVFYVSTTDDKGDSELVNDTVMSTWNSHWLAKHNEFEEFLKSDPYLAPLSGKMFFVWDGNHRQIAWSEAIDTLHPDERKWHYSVKAIVLVTVGHTSMLINAMNDINRYDIHSR